jgi:NAD(P) transhydrogenase subunit alpha
MQSRIISPEESFASSKLNQLRGQKMSLTIGVPRETIDGEQRVAIAPEVVTNLGKLNVNVLIESGAGDSAYTPDSKFQGDNLKFASTASEVYQNADVIFKVQCPTSEEISLLKSGTLIVGSFNPFKNLDRISEMKTAGLTSWTTEFIPRISRAQSMDTLSSQAAVAGYLGVLKAATLTAKFFPMLTTAAGTIRPAKVLVLGAGVAGLQAIATAKRLGAVIEAYDIRPETKEQCESLGAKFVDTGIDASGEGGYARELTAEEQAKQKEIVDQHIIKSDCVITTAAIPGRPSPKLVDEACVKAMQPGAVIVDLASEGGGNCALTQPGETIEAHGVIVDGPLNVPSDLALHASEMFAKNLLNFITPLIESSETDAQLKIDWGDEVIAKACLTHNAEIKHEMVKKLIEENG